MGRLHTRMRCRIRLIAQCSVAITVGAMALAVHAGGQDRVVPPPAKESVNVCLPETGSRSWCGDGGPALSAKLAGPSDVAVAKDGSLIIADTLNNVIRRVRSDSIVSIAGTGEREQSSGTQAAARTEFAAPEAVATAMNGDILVADTGNDALRSISVDGVVRTLVSASVGTEVALEAPRDVVVLPDNAVLISDSGHHRVLRIKAGVPEIVAGSSKEGYSGDGGPATEAQLRRPTQIATTVDGTLFIADTGNSAVRRVLPSGVIETVTRAVARPIGVHALPSGEVIVTNEAGVHLLASDGTTRRLAGGVASGYNGDGGRASEVLLDDVAQIAPGADGRLMIAERGNDRVRVLDIAGGVITTAAGSGRPLEISKPDIPPRPPPAALRRLRAARAAVVAQSAQASGCNDYDARFATFNLVPATSEMLKRKPRKRIRFSFKTSRRANVVIQLYKSGKLAATNTRKRVPVMPRRRARRISVKRKQGQIRGKYVVWLWGEDAGSGVLRCDSRRVRVK